MYLLDTDSLTHFAVGTPSIVKRIRNVGQSNIATTIISRIEVLLGRFNSILKAENAERLLVAQERLRHSEEFLSQVPIVAMNQDVASQFDHLRKQKQLKKIGRRDMLIACIVLANRDTLVTRNLKDFKLIPNLKCENWID